MRQIKTSCRFAKVSRVQQFSPRFVIYLLIGLLILTPMQAVLGCGNLLAPHHQSKVLKINSIGESASISAIDQDHQGHHCISQTKCKGDHCGHLVLLLNGKPVKPIRQSHIFQVTQFFDHPQLVVDKHLRPPISTGLI